MATTRSHSCVFFDDDGWSEPVCACGQRALRTRDETGTDAVLVLLDSETVLDALTGVGGRSRDELAISA